MWTLIQTVGGWPLFYGLFIFSVRWMGTERTFSSAQDPERWEPDVAHDFPSAKEERPHVATLLLRFPSMGMPA